MKICFPCTNRVHLARQKLLLDELAKNNEVVIADISHEIENQKGNPMADVAGAYAVAFGKYLRKVQPDIVLIRGDRYEQLPLAMCSAYLQIPIAHLEGFDLSGIVDNRVRYAISYLSDYHFVTNKESLKRAKDMNFENVWNCGSLDVEYALSVQGECEAKRPYLVALWHNIPNETQNAMAKALEGFEYDIKGIKGNDDYDKSEYTEEYPPDEFIRLLKGASCIVGNSSAGIKECSVLGVPVVNIGSRQANRTRTQNVRDCECEPKDIQDAIVKQLEHGRYLPDYTYYSPDTSKQIASVINSLQS